METEAPLAQTLAVEPTLQNSPTLQDAVLALRGSGQMSLPVRDPDTGRIAALLSLPPAPPPPRLGGMATPLGVYLHDGVSSGGAGFWGLVLTGMTMSVLALTAKFLAHCLGRFTAAHWPSLSVWESRLPYGLPSLLSAISPELPLPFVFLLLRLVPLSGTHAAEHQTVHCVERQLPLTVGTVRTMPRIHPRCGTNIFAGFTLFLLLFLGIFSATQSQRWQLLDSVTLAAAVSGPATLVYWRRLGGWVQEWLATRPATSAQIAGAIRAAEQVLARRRKRLEHPQPPRFLPLRRLWAMGLAQILLGYAIVLGLLTGAGLLWPGLIAWLE